MEAQGSGSKKPQLIFLPFMYSDQNNLEKRKLMTFDQVRTPEQALVYLLDCTLATVEHMASLKSRNKTEFKRQIGIAQKGVDWIIAMKIDSSTSRASDVIEAGGNVAKWIEPRIVS